MRFQLNPHTSYLIPHTPYLIPHTSYLIPHTSCLGLRTSYLGLGGGVGTVVRCVHYSHELSLARLLRRCELTSDLGPRTSGGRGRGRGRFCTKPIVAPKMFEIISLKFKVCQDFNQGNVQRLCIWLCTKPIVAPNMFEIISPQLKVYQTPLFFSSACTILASIAICLPSIATFLPSIATFLPNIATPTKKLLLSRKFSYFRENHII